MDRKFFASLYKERKLPAGQGYLRYFDLIFLLAVTLLGLLTRYVFRNVETMDYTICLGPWVEGFRQNGRAFFLDDSFNYTMPYMTFLYLISKLPFRDLYLIKAFSTFFDLVLAVLCGKIVFHITGNRTRSLLCFGTVFCLPTVAVNSGLWGQCDCIYTTFLVASLYCILKDQSHRSMILYGIAFAIKLQSLFIFPFYVYLWVRKKVSIGQFFYIPLMYLAGCLPGLLAGRDLKRLLLTYVGQGNTEPWMLTWYWPNVYMLFGQTNFWKIYGKTGVLFCAAILMLLLYGLVKKRVALSGENHLQILLLFSWGVLLFLPYMHERYAYPADLLAIMLAFTLPKKWPIPVAAVFLSAVAYSGYLHGGCAFSQQPLCIIMIGLFGYGIRQVFFAKNPEMTSREEL
ncbi:MAG: hypothetical protein K5739_00435 [Lachnospiraceae bacterium]|nr:hypothetical protein [Lachnospiraceae bacterium]